MIENKLQLVCQYQTAAAASAQGLRVTVPHDRESVMPNFNGGYGDAHHSLYAGVNYHLCDQYAKIQAGVEWQTMETPAGPFDTISWVLALRTSF